jgi:superfamily II DNA or RNA helicase
MAIQSKLVDSYNLLEYQREPITKLTDYLLGNSGYAQCLLSAGTGSGKTYSMAYVINKLNTKTLILSHLTMLGIQMFAEISKNLTDIDIAILTNTTDKLPDIAISSFQLLAQNPELLQRISDNYGLVIVDEAENCVSESRLKVLFSLRPKYQIYLTATPTKELVQQTKAVEYLYGNVMFLMQQPEDKKIHSRHIMLDYRHLTWQSPAMQNMYKVSLGKFIRDKGIADDVIKLCRILIDKNYQGTYWIVADLNKVQDYLKVRLDAIGISTEIIRGGVSNKKRETILHNIQEDKVKILIGSAPLSAGISIPRLSIGIRLMPNSSSEELLTQQKGRLNRFTEFKATQSPIWFDFVISGSLIYGARKRYSMYKNSVHGAKFVTLENIEKEI